MADKFITEFLAGKITKKELVEKLDILWSKNRNEYWYLWAFLDRHKLL